MMIVGTVWIYAVKRRHGTLSVRVFDAKEASAG